MRVEYYRGAKKEWRWRVRARNGRIVSESSEGYRRFRSCQNGLALTREALEHCIPSGAPASRQR